MIYTQINVLYLEVKVISAQYILLFLATSYNHEV